MKAIEVSLNGKVIGVYIPPDDQPFSVMMANIPRSYIRAQVLASDDEERWQWQLPDIQEGEIISFRMIEAERENGVRPHRVTKRDPEEVAEYKRLGKEAYERVMRERDSDRQRSAISAIN